MPDAAAGNEPCREEEILRYLRAQRHSLMNRLQEVVGWLQLGRSDRSDQVLTALRDRFASENALIRFLPPPVAGLILGQAVLTEDQGIGIRYEVLSVGPIRLPPNWSEMRDDVRMAWQELVDLALRRGRREILWVVWNKRRLHLRLREADAAPLLRETELAPSDDLTGDSVDDGSSSPALARISRHVDSRLSVEIDWPPDDGP